jgi:hypothetical protein
MARRRAWISLILAPVVSGGVIVACGSTPDDPPINGGIYKGGTSGGSTGGGDLEGGSGVTECVAQGGVCTESGNLIEGGGSSCPVDLNLSCGAGSVSDSGQAVLVCCGGYNDAGAPEVGAPDVVHDTSGQ